METYLKIAYDVGSKTAAETFGVQPTAAIKRKVANLTGSVGWREESRAPGKLSGEHK